MTSTFRWVIHITPDLEIPSLLLLWRFFISTTFKPYSLFIKICNLATPETQKPCPYLLGAARLALSLSLYQSLISPWSPTHNTSPFFYSVMSLWLFPPSLPAWSSNIPSNTIQRNAIKQIHVNFPHLSPHCKLVIYFSPYFLPIITCLANVVLISSLQFHLLCTLENKITFKNSAKVTISHPFNWQKSVSRLHFVHPLTTYSLINSYHCTNHVLKSK
jgi:hypothetical protein